MTLADIRKALRKAQITDAALWLSSSDGDLACIRIIVPMHGSKKLARKLRAALLPGTPTNRSNG